MPTSIHGARVQEAVLPHVLPPWVHRSGQRAAQPPTLAITAVQADTNTTRTNAAATCATVEADTGTTQNHAATTFAAVEADTDTTRVNAADTFHDRPRATTRRHFCTANTVGTDSAVAPSSG